MKDMTQGRPMKVLLRFSAPILFSMIFQQLYNIIDSIIVGQFVGEDGLAAVGASYPVTVLFLAIATGSGMGVTVSVSQIFGAKQMTRLKSAVSTAMITMTVIGVGSTALGLIISYPLLKLLKTPENIFSASLSYLLIYVGGVLFLLLYNAANAVFTALGDSKTPLCFLIFSSILNVILDLWFVAGLSAGVTGAAAATVIAQGTASALALLTLFVRLRKLPHEGSYKRFDKELLVRIGRVAVPSILQQSFVSVGQLFVQGVINDFGSGVMAGYSAAFKINTFVIASFTAFGNAVSSFTAQNYGAGKYRRIQEGQRVARIAVEAFALVVFVFAFVFAKPLIGLFVDVKESPTVVQVGVEFLRIVTPFYLVVSLKLAADGVIRGVGRMKEFMISTFSDLILRVLLSYILVIPFGYIGIWWAFPLGWIIGTGLSLWFCERIMKEGMRNEQKGMF